jgi:hypothetical protein
MCLAHPLLCTAVCCSALMASPPYKALLGLDASGACSEGGAGDGLLAGLSSAMQGHLLRWEQQGVTAYGSLAAFTA